MQTIDAFLRQSVAVDLVVGPISLDESVGGFGVMPLYEYRCLKCGHRFEEIRKFSDPPLEVCPECGTADRKENPDIVLLHVGNKAIRGCIACQKCFKNKDNQCSVKKDTFNEIFAKMLKADAIILGSPTYFAAVSADLKALIETEGEWCVSILMPTVRTGTEVQQNPIRFRNLLREAENQHVTGSACVCTSIARDARECVGAQVVSQERFR